jgi:hypothetical protein
MNNLYLFPALLFPVIPLMMISFGNRYTAMSTLIRKLHDDFIKQKKKLSKKSKERTLAEIKILTTRLKINRYVQTLGGLALALNLSAIFCLYKQNDEMFYWVFGTALGFFTVSILLFVAELQVSVLALKKHLEDLGDL